MDTARSVAAPHDRDMTLARNVGYRPTLPKVMHIGWDGAFAGTT